MAPTKIDRFTFRLGRRLDDALNILHHVIAGAAELIVVTMFLSALGVWEIVLAAAVR